MKQVSSQRLAVSRQREQAERSRKVVSRILLLAVYALLLAAYCGPISAQPGVPKMNSPLYGQRPDIGEPSSGLPPALQKVSFEQRLNEQVPLDLKFRDETGREVRLADYFREGRPVILSLVFYECPMLCNQVLNGLVSSIKTLSFNAGKEFEVLTVSFDPREGPELARAKKEAYMLRYQRPGTEDGWQFLTGDPAAIEALTRAVGFHYYYDTATNQFAHASGVVLLTPDGKISRYFYGIDYSARDLRLGLVEASANKIGSPVDQLLLYCYHYDPATGKYGPVVMNIMRIGGILTLLGIASLILLLRRRGGDASARLSQGGTA
jgi:protein SCO1/2